MGKLRRLSGIGGRIIDLSRGRPVFILGCPRSGTTLLGLMLQAHHRIAIPSENRFLLPAYFRRAEFGDLAEPENRRHLAEMIVGSEWFDDLGLASARIVEEMVASSWTVGSAAGLVLRAYANRFGKIRWGDKRPNYRNHVWVIQRLFPDAQFVHLIRDGRDCVASMRQVPPWDRKGFYARVCAWMEAIEQGQRHRERLPADTFYELRYEELVNDPRKQLSGLCDFLGEAFDEAMLNPQGIASDVVPDHQTWHVRTREAISSSSIGRFEERLESWELEVCEAVMADQLRACGYELAGAQPPPETRLEEYLKVEKGQRRRLQKRWQRDLAREYHWPVAEMSASEAEQRRRVIDLEHEIKSLRERGDAVTRERNLARDRLEDIYGSRSWRWTRPLRATRRMWK